MLNWRRRLAIVLLDALLGAFIGPLNLLGLILLGGLSLVPQASGPKVAAAGLFHLFGAMLKVEGGPWLLVPSFLSTLLLAPFLLRHLERLPRAPSAEFRFRTARAGVVFGFAATFVTVAFGFLVVRFVEGDPRALGPASQLAGAVLAGGIGFSIVCAPAIVVSGNLFGLLNGELVRRLAEPPPPPPPRFESAGI